ncbi:MAG: lytic transglycosylase F [Bradyrhizobiaceae bacterium]|nr:MAG: lytic transglycosylase F [Bradyrhizobiaceae bacterium]
MNVVFRCADWRPARWIVTGLVAALAAFHIVSASAEGASQATQKPHVLALPGVRAWNGDLDGMLKRRTIRVLVPFSKTFFFLDGGRTLGVAAELGHEFQNVLNRKYGKKPYKIYVAFVPTRRDLLLSELIAGKGDIAVGNLTITSERSAQVDFTQPWLTGVKEVLVTGPSAPEVKSLDDLGGKEIKLRRSSSYYEHLAAVNAQRKSEGKSLIKVADADENLEDEDLLEMVSRGLMPWVIVDGHKAKLWAGILGGLTVHDDIFVNDGGEIAWAIRKNSPLLKAELDDFISKNKIGTAFGNDLKLRYFTPARVIKNAAARSEKDKLAPLLGYFRTYGNSMLLDPLLLAAQGYQESGFDQKMRNATGAVGVMQIKPSTAREKQVAINDVVTRAEDNIHAGAKYMRFLANTYIKDPAINARERTLMALAAYNAGPGNLKRFRDYAEKHGFSSTSWFGNVEYGAAAIVGQETVQYVSNIYKYYVVYSSSNLVNDASPAAAASSEAAASPAK